MATDGQDREREPVAATTRSEDGDRYDPLQIALRHARDAFDPDRAHMERRGPTAPLVWYIEDAPDLGLPKPGGDAELRTP